MDKIKLLGTICLLFIFFTPKTQAQIKITKKIVRVNISPEWTKDSLDFAKKRITKETKINFSYRDLHLYADHTIKRVFIEVDCNDGYSGSAVLNNEKYEDKGFGFVRDYRLFKLPTFQVGYIPYDDYKW